MKELEVLGNGANYTAVSVGSFDDVRGYDLPLAPGVTINGKVFTGQALKSTGMEMSLQTYAAGEASAFAHAHKKHEELYVIIKGEGEFRVDDSLIPVAEGSLVRVAPAGKRAVRNTGKGDLIVMCLQYIADVFGAADTPAEDGIILQEEVFPEGLTK